MKYSRHVLCGVVIVVLALLSGCAGLSQQYRASTEGISVNYTVKKEQFADPKAKIIVSSSDERLDKDIVGDGAKSSAGSRALGYVAFGIIYAAFPDQPTLKDQQDPIRIFKTAMAERLSKNGTGDYTMQEIATCFRVHYATVSRAVKKNEASMRDCKT